MFISRDQATMKKQQFVIAAILQLAFLSPAAASCDWVRSSGNTEGEMYVGWAFSEDECVALVQEHCPWANIAAVHEDAFDSGDFGSCWCQTGSDRTEDIYSPWFSCFFDDADSFDSAESSYDEFECDWIQNNANIHGEEWVGWAFTAEECVELVRDYCPWANIANVHRDVFINGVDGDCWCQSGSDKTEDPYSSYYSCWIREEGLPLNVALIIGVVVAIACVLALIAGCWCFRKRRAVPMDEVGGGAREIRIAQAMPVAVPAMARDTDYEGKHSGREMVTLWMATTVGLPEYSEVLINNGYDVMSVIATLSTGDLDRMGITKIGHQKQIMSKVREMGAAAAAAQSLQQHRAAEVPPAAALQYASVPNGTPTEPDAALQYAYYSPAR